MKNFVFLPLIACLLSSCATNYSKLGGTYQSECILYDRSSLIMELNNNHTFSYKIAYVEDTITGTWQINGDTLILNSKYFDDEYIRSQFPDVPRELVPAYKYTDSEEGDVYLIKGNKLLLKSKDGFNTECHLLKVK